MGPHLRPITRSITRPLALMVAVLFVVAGLATACGGDDSSASAGSSTTAKVKDDGGEVTVVAKDFSLTSVTAKPGAEVYLDNQGGTAHTLTADDGSFDTGHVQPGKQAEVHAPTAPGTYQYHCSIHSSMTGTLTVTS